MKPLLNIEELITDPDFCQSFIILRREGTWDKGRFNTTETEIDTYGVIDPQSTKEMQFDPNGVLLKGIIKVYTHLELYTTQKNNSDGKSYNSDIVIWQGNHYIVLDEGNYSDYGYRAYTCQLKDAAGVTEY